MAMKCVLGWILTIVGVGYLALTGAIFISWLGDTSQTLDINTPLVVAAFVIGMAGLYLKEKRADTK